MLWPLPKGETTITTKFSLKKPSRSQIERLITQSLDKHKAEKIVSIDLNGKSDVADCMIVASGTSLRHVGALAEYVVEVLKSAGFESVPVEGRDTCEWVLVDAGDIIVHLFHPDARSHYNLEKMWSVSVPQLEAAH